jgi:DNA-directed RNA polymerase specialized sigma24 family protein
LDEDGFPEFVRARLNRLSRVPDRPATDGAEAALRRVMVQQALARLTPKQRSVIVLRYFEDLSEADTAAAMAAPPGP